MLEALHEIWPEAPVYTSVYLPEAMPPAYRKWDIRTSFMQRLPGLRRHFRKYLPLFPLAFEQMDLSGYDLVLDNSSAFSYGVVTRPETLHLSYCLTPARFLWGYHDYIRREALGTAAQLALAPFIAPLRAWDRLAADRVDHFATTAEYVRARIRKHYRRDAAVIPAPVDCSRFAVSTDPPGDYFLSVSRLAPYRRIDLAVEACRRIGARLKVVGAGRDRDRLERLAGGDPRIEFLGRVPDAEVRDLWAGCRAYLVPGEEDFGIAPLEANAAGRPVVAYAAGGALETVIEDETGVFFREQTVDALAEALARLDPAAFDPARLRAHAEQYDVPVFKERIAAWVREKVDCRPWS